MAGPPNRSGLIAGEGIHLMAPGARQLRLCEIRPVAVVLMSSLPHGRMAAWPHGRLSGPPVSRRRKITARPASGRTKEADKWQHVSYPASRKQLKSTRDVGMLACFDEIQIRQFRLRTLNPQTGSVPSCDRCPLC